MRSFVKQPNLTSAINGRSFRVDDPNASLAETPIQETVRPTADGEGLTFKTPRTPGRSLVISTLQARNIDRHNHKVATLTKMATEHLEAQKRAVEDEGEIALLHPEPIHVTPG